MPSGNRPHFPPFPHSIRHSGRYDKNWQTKSVTNVTKTQKDTQLEQAESNWTTGYIWKEVGLLTIIILWCSSTSHYPWFPFLFSLTRFWWTCFTGYTCTIHHERSIKWTLTASLAAHRAGHDFWVIAGPGTHTATVIPHHPKLTGMQFWKSKKTQNSEGM